ncbi:MAG: WD40 repeat domain-containing protein, partial [Myxococcales bacterium]|nr:WD40 repeat domain-containing protein [Myxococcales bacterium]
SDNGEQALTAAEDGSVCVWNIEDGQVGDCTKLVHESVVVHAGFSSIADDFRHIVTITRGGVVRVWHADSSGEPVMLQESVKISAASFSPDGLTIATGGIDGRVRLWTQDTRTLTTLLRGATSACVSVMDRKEYLGQSHADACVAFQRCEADNGRKSACPDL